ncbi:hypothetical protein [Sulfurimonas sp. CS5]|jgi:hypothetical protein|uniref:hypothetical protein n=1 Tax=Sulfurimonas sp. CS5 TaxID=3391145 RepID=UPI0039EA7F1C
MLKLIFIILLLLPSLDAKDITLTFKLRSIGYVSDFVVDANHLYAANDMKYYISNPEALAHYQLNSGDYVVCVTFSNSITYTRCVILIYLFFTSFTNTP